jgi:hypothetical protein
VEHLNFWGSIITYDAMCTREIKSRTAMAKAKFNKKTFFTIKLHLNLRKKPVKRYIWSAGLYGTKTWGDTWKVDQKYLGKF